MVPHSFKMVSQPWTVPGTVMDSTPMKGISPWPLSLSSRADAAAGARPLPLMARMLLSALFQTIANMSPPTPVETTSTTFKVAAAATAASTGLPPSIRIFRPAMAARGWLVATMPFLAWTVERLESKNIWGTPEIVFRMKLYGPVQVAWAGPFYHRAH